MQENSMRAKNGYFMLVTHLLLIAANLIIFIVATGTENAPLFLVFGIVGLLILFMFPGYFVINPNEAKVLLLFGKYKGTVKDNGFLWVNPFYTKRSISLRARNLNGEKIKVNDKNGNPIVISAVIVWQVDNTAKAMFAVDNYATYVDTQSEAALRSLAGRYPYDNFETDNEETVTLRTEAKTVNHMLEQELTERLDRAGIKILEARINHLAYAEEIASAMLQRQQAAAVVAARRQIVAGAVGIVEMALQHLSDKNLIQFNEERKAALISNLLVVLTGERSAQPVIHTGTDPQR